MALRSSLGRNAGFVVWFAKLTGVQALSFVVFSFILVGKGLILFTSLFGRGLNTPNMDVVQALKKRPGALPGKQMPFARL